MTWLLRRFLGRLVTEETVGDLLARLCDLLTSLAARSHTTLDDRAVAEVRRLLTDPQVVAWLTQTLLAILGGASVPLVPDATATLAVKK